MDLLLMLCAYTPGIYDRWHAPVVDSETDISQSNLSTRSRSQLVLCPFPIVLTLHAWALLVHTLQHARRPTPNLHSHGQQEQFLKQQLVLIAGLIKERGVGGRRAQEESIAFCRTHHVRCLCRIMKYNWFDFSIMMCDNWSEWICKPEHNLEWNVYLDF